MASPATVGYSCPGARAAADARIQGVGRTPREATDEEEGGGGGCAGLPPVPREQVDRSEGQLIAQVLRRLLTTAETGTRRLRRRNIVALRLTIK